MPCADLISFGKTWSKQGETRSYRHFGRRCTKLFIAAADPRIKAVAPVLRQHSWAQISTRTIDGHCDCMMPVIHIRSIFRISELWSLQGLFSLAGRPRWINRVESVRRIYADLKSFMSFMMQLKRRIRWDTRWPFISSIIQRKDIFFFPWTPDGKNITPRKQETLISRPKAPIRGNFKGIYRWTPRMTAYNNPGFFCKACRVSEILSENELVFLRDSTRDF